MMLCDKTIRELCIKQSVGGVLYLPHWKPMIEPFSEGCDEGVISYGLTSAGYDLRLARGVKVFKNSFAEVIDPFKFKDPAYHDRVFDLVDNEEVVRIPSRGYILGMSFEYLRIPRYLKARCVGKSTYARCGILINTTPLEPGWEGHLTIEISNLNPCDALVYIMQGIAQMEVEMLDAVPAQTYADKHQGQPGKYQGQTEVTPPRMFSK